MEELYLVTRCGRAREKVSARQGWAGEKGHLERPAATLTLS
jgi:hypothetical protein